MEHRWTDSDATGDSVCADVPMGWEECRWCFPRESFPTSACNLCRNWAGLVYSRTNCSRYTGIYIHRQLYLTWNIHRFYWRSYRCHLINFEKSFHSGETVNLRDPSRPPTKTCHWPRRYLMCIACEIRPHTNTGWWKMKKNKTKYYRVEIKHQYIRSVCGEVQFPFAPPLSYTQSSSPRSDFQYLYTLQLIENIILIIINHSDKDDI